HLTLVTWDAIESLEDVEEHVAVGRGFARGCIDQKMRQSCRLRIELSDARIGLPRLLAQAQQIGEGDVLVLDQREVPGGLEPLGLDPADRSVSREELE